MVYENNLKPIIENKKPVEEVRQIEEEIRLPKLSEITDKDGKVKLPPELIEKLRDPNARFRIDVVAFPFGDETALMIVKSAAIMNRLSRDYPTISRLFEGNRSGTMNFLKANGAFSTYRVSREFYVDHTGERDGVKVWKDYGRKIDDYVDDLCRRMRDSKGQSHYEQLRPAAPVLAGEIYQKYYNRFPYWPSTSQREQSDNVEVNVASSHVYYVYHIVWSCVGRVFVKDTRPDYNTYKAEFSGSPEIKILELDYSRMKELEDIVNQRSFSEAERMIRDKDRNRDSRLLTWDSLR